MELQNPDIKMRHEAMPGAATHNASSTNYQPVSHGLRIALLFTLPVYAVISLLATSLVYKTLSDGTMKRFRICIFLRFLAIVDGLMVVATLGLSWMFLVLPPDDTWDTGLTDRVCSLYTFCKLSLEDIGIYVLVMAGLERLYSRLKKSSMSFTAIFFASHHQVRVTCFFARLALLFWAGIMIVLNLPLLYENRFQSDGVTSMGQCLNTWRITGDKNGNFTTTRMHTLFGTMLAACILIIGCFLKCSNRPKPCQTIQQPEEPEQEVRVCHVNVWSLPVETLTPKNRKTWSLESVTQNETQDTSTAGSVTEEFCTVYKTIQICRWRGYALGLHLVLCDKKDVPSRHQDLQFDRMVLAYTLLYLIFEIPQIVMTSMSGPIFKHCGQALVTFLDMTANIISGTRPAFVFGTYSLVGMELFNDSLIRLMHKVSFSSDMCRNARTDIVMTNMGWPASKELVKTMNIISGSRPSFVYCMYFSITLELFADSLIWILNQIPFSPFVFRLGDPRRNVED